MVEGVKKEAKFLLASGAVLEENIGGQDKKVDDLFSRRPQNKGQTNKSTTPTLQKSPPV